MPETPKTTPSGGDLLSIAQVCDEYGVSRQALHTRRTDPAWEFPAGVPVAGSTRPKFRRSDLDAHFAKHPVAPGRRTDLEGGHDGAE